MSETKKVVLRGGPSPTSPYGLHVGNLRTLLYNYLFARKNNGTFFLRIEDTDQGRFEKGAEELIRKSLEWTGMDTDYSPWQGGPNEPYRQSERDYSTHIAYLINNDLAYYAFDTKEELDDAREENKYFSYNQVNRLKMRNSLTLSEEETADLIEKGGYVIRFKVPTDKVVSFDDLIRGKVQFNSSTLDDKILLKSNGIGSYHLCNVCDDHDMGTTHVVRGEEWLPSTPLHVLLYDAFGWDLPTFAHLPLIMNPPGHKGKLSKRKSLNLGFPIFPFGGKEVTESGEDLIIPGFFDQGYEVKALINFIALLGWNPGTDNEIFSMEELIHKFSFDRVSRSGAKFDIEKLHWFNSQYVNKLELEEIFSDDDFENIEFVQLEKIAVLAKERAVFRRDLYPIINIFTKPVTSYSDETKFNEEYKDTFNVFVEKINDISLENGQDIKDLIYTICVKDLGHKFGKIMPGLREALTGGISGPDLMTTIQILGKDEAILRIKNTL
jgi:glutamyl-tRNA synthetase